jgi:hypothetical protein
MSFLEVQVGSYVAKKIDDFLKFLKKLEQCTTFEGKKIKKLNLELEKKIHEPLTNLFLFLGSLGNSKLMSKIKF